MDPSTIQTAAFVLEATKNNLGVSISEITTGTASYDAGLRKAVFTPSQKLLPNYTYRLFISSSVKDSFGNQIDQNKTITFTTAISKNYDAVLSDPGRLTYISISAGSIPEESFYLDIQSSPNETGAIKQAFEKVPNGSVPFLAAAPGTVRSVKLYSGSFPGTLVENPRFAIPVSVTIPYTEENGIVSGTNPPVHESTLAIYC